MKEPEGLGERVELTKMSWDSCTVGDENTAARSAFARASLCLTLSTVRRLSKCTMKEGAAQRNK